MSVGVCGNVDDVKGNQVVVRLLRGGINVNAGEQLKIVCC